MTVAFRTTIYSGAGEICFKQAAHFVLYKKLKLIAA